jgi:hypothetical protein
MPKATIFSLLIISSNILISMEQDIAKNILRKKAISGREFLTRLMASVDETTFFKIGDEINYTLQDRHYLNTLIKTKVLQGTLSNLALRKFTITNDAHSENKDIIFCEPKDCSPKFKLDKSLRYDTIINPIRHVQFYAILEHNTIFSPKLLVAQYEIDVYYNSRETFRNLILKKIYTYIDNPSFEKCAERIKNYPNLIDSKSACLNAILLLKRK